MNPTLKKLFKSGAILTLSGISCYTTYKSDSTFLKIATAGVLSQVMTDMMVHPIDLINVRTKSNIHLNLNSRNTLNSILSYEGVRGLFKGLNFLVYSSFFAGLLYFTVYEKMKPNIKAFCVKNELSLGFAYSLSAFLAECTLFIFYYPFDLIKNKVITERYYFVNMSDALTKIYKETSLKSEGKNVFSNLFRNLYFGFFSSLVQSSSQMVIMFTVFEMARDVMAEMKQVPAEKIKGVEYFFCAFLGGFASASLLNFLEVYSIQRQIHGNAISLRQFMVNGELKTLTRGYVSKMSFGIFYTVVLLETMKFFSDLYGVSI